LINKTIVRLLTLIIALCIASISVCSAQDEKPRTLTLEQAITSAVEHSPALAAARERKIKSEWAARESSTLDNLKLNGTLNYAHISPVSTFTMPGPTGPITVQVRPPSTTTINGTLSKPIDIFGKIGLAQNISKLQVDIQTQAEALALQKLIADVKSAYFGVLRAQAAVEVANSALTAAQERLRTAKAQYEVGAAPKFDMTRAEVDVANYTQSLTQAQNAVKLAKAALNQTIGVDVSTEFELVSEDTDVQPVTVDIAECTEQALKKRPEMVQALTGIELAQKGISLARKDNSPTVGLFLSTDWTSETSAFSSNKTTYTYGASISWPIWTGGQTTAKVSQAKSDLEIAKLGLEQAKLGVELDVRSAALNMMDASSRVGAAKSNVALAEEALRLAKVRYREGVSTQVEVTDAEAALTLARTNYINAVYDYLTAKAQFERATCSQPEFTKLAAADKSNTTR